MKVNTTHPDYDSHFLDWQTIRSCVEGERAVKAAGKLYLPSPDFSLISGKKEAETRYDEYKLRAVFYPVTGHTLTGYVGTVFAKEPAYKVPEPLEPYMKDVDGVGTHLFQQAQKVFRETLSLGRCGVLVDYPQTTAPTTRQQALALAVRPTAVIYTAESILNWRVQAFNGVRKLVLLVLREYTTEAKNEFESEAVVYYRVLRLEEGRRYSVETYKSKGQGEPASTGPRVYPRDGTGNEWDVIPFVAVGASNNDFDVDNPPLLDLALLNLAHYRNSADFEDSVHVVGQPTPVFTGLTEHWFREVLGSRIVLGSRAGVALPEGASAMLLQANPNTLCQTAMEGKEAQMVAIGARLVQQQTVQRTATEAGIDAAGDATTLGMVANNVSRAYVVVLGWLGRFANVDPDGITFELSKDHMRQLLDTASRAQLVSEWQAGAISFTEMRNGFRRAGIATEDDAAVEAKADKGIDPLAGSDTQV